MFRNNEIFGFYLEIFVIIFAPVILYWNELVLIFNEAINNDLSTHIIAIPFLVLYIIYRERTYLKAVINWREEKQKTILKQELVGSLLGILICSIAFMWKLYGLTTFHSLEYNALSFPIFDAVAVMATIGI